jgi:hypothetical protein
MPRLRLWQPQERLDLLLRGRRNRQHDPFARDRLRRCHAEHHLRRRPRRQAIDLGTDHAVEEIGRGLWKIDGAEQQLLRSHNHLDTAAAQRRLPFPAECALKAAIEQAERRLRQDCALAR